MKQLWPAVKIVLFDLVSISEETKIDDLVDSCHESETKGDNWNITDLPTPVEKKKKKNKSISLKSRVRCGPFLLHTDENIFFDTT